MRPVLALDMDDLLFPFISTFSEQYNKTYEAAFTLDEYVTFDFWKVWNISMEETFDRVVHIQRHLIDDTANHFPIDGAVDGVAELSQDFRLFIVTSRPDEYREHTDLWLKQHFDGVFEQVVLCNTYAQDGRPTRTKAEVLEEINAVGLVDDSLNHAQEIAAIGRRFVLFGDYAWNKTRDTLPQSVQYASDWPEVVSAVKGWIDQ